jgi:hypothetical protein
MSGFLLDDHGLDVGKRRKLRRQRQPCRPAAGDQDIDALGEGIRGCDALGCPAASEISGLPGLNPLR